MSWDWIWWSIMVAIGACNWVLGARICLRSRRRPAHSVAYGRLLRVMGMVFLSVALYRTLFVSSYPNRLAWFDTLLNSPFVIRCLGMFAELSFIGMIGLILLKLDRDLPLERGAWLSRTPYIAMGLIALAQFFAFGGLIAQSNVLFAIEETLWALSFMSITPLVLLHLVDYYRYMTSAQGYRGFLLVMTVWCVGYLLFQCGYALPFMYYADALNDAAKAVPKDALQAAITGFTATRDYQTWGGAGFFVWHSGYFSLCAWMTLLFMTAPHEKHGEEME